MLFFRSEERLVEWCNANQHSKGPSVTMAQLWGLAIAWYSSRLDADAHRPQPEEMKRIFTGFGLTGDFWDPQADSFGTSPGGAPK